MTRFLKFESRRRILFCLFVLAVLTAVFALPFQMRSNAAKGMFQRTESHDADLPNYDIRADKAAIDKIVAFRTAQGKNASLVADARESFVRGENALRQHVPTLRIEYNSDIRIPEVIGPDVQQGRAFLTSRTTPAGTSHADVLINFLKQNTELVGASAAQIEGLKVVADYTNPDGNLSYVELNQEINGIPVFRGEVKAGFTKQGEMIRVINNLAPALDYASLSTDFRDPLDAVRAAATFIHNDMSKLDLRKNSKESTDLKTVFGTGDFGVTAEKMYFPTEPSVAVPAWRVLIWQPVNAYYVIVDAETGTMLWRKNIVQDQTQSATYNVYANPNAMIDVSDNPFPLTPGPTSTNGVQGTGIPRTMKTLIGNEAPYTFNNNGWINDGSNTTDGNAVQAGLDRDSVNGVDTSGSPTGAPDRIFDYPFTPGIPTNPAQNGGDSPLPAGSVPSPCVATAPSVIDYQRAAVTQLFYVTNRYHDETYLLGFTEQARNFQQDNFGRGGVAADRVSAEAQDCSGSNNANFGTPADGGRGRMQMYLWTGPTPDFDGDLDADVIVHEFTHGLSNRLHGNSSGLSTNMSGGMGEGWSDFYAHSLLSEPTDPIMGIYTTGSYATYGAQSGTFFNNYYYGIRRFPKAVIAFTGGPNNRPHNCMTFADTDSSQINISDCAYPRGPFGSATADAVHNLGEIWSSALWEVRAKLITRLGWAVGNKKTLQLVTDGMKLAPLGPTFLTERDAIIAAAQASSFAPEAAADVADVWGGFALRGMGASASIQNPGSGSGDTRVTEAFDLPNLFQSPNLTLSDTGTGNGNGYPEPGETITLTIPLSNTTGNDATGTTLQIVGGGSANYGTIANGATVSRQISYTVPAGTGCGTTVTLTLNVNSSLGATSFSRTLIIGQPNITFTENFDGVTAPAFPDGWTATAVQSGINFVTVASASDTAPNSAFAQDPAATGGGSDLTSPPIAITAAAATVTFRNNYNTESGWDGGALEISIAGGAFQDIVAAGGAFVQNGYNGTLGAYSGSNNPIEGRAAWTGDSGGFITTTARLPAAAAGQNVVLKWRFGADNNTAAVGWWVDSIQVAGAYTCSTAPMPSISGTVTYGNAAAPPKYISNVSVTGTGSPVVSTTTAAPGVSEGQYTLTGFGSGSYTVSLSKTTGQNGITSNDAARVAQHVAGVAPLTTNSQKVAADVTDNGALSSNDAAQIARYVAGVGPIGLTNQWRFFVTPGLTFPIGASPTSRTYSSVTSNIAGEDYVGLLMGEVTGNWSPSAARLISGERKARGNAPERAATVTLPNVVTPADKEFVLPVRVQGVADKNVISYEFDLRYDPAVIQPAAEPVDAAGSVSRGLTFVINDKSPGLLRVVVYGAYPIAEDGLLLNLRFTVVGAPDSSSLLHWDRLMFNEGDPQVNLSDGRIMISTAK